MTVVAMAPTLSSSSVESSDRRYQYSRRRTFPGALGVRAQPLGQFGPM